MDLIYTDAKRVDQGVLNAYAFDLSYGEAENDYEMTVGVNDAVLEYGAFLYMENTEYGGIVDAMKTSTNGDTVSYTGRTWHGILNSKVIEPDTGEDYFVVSGDANKVLSVLVDRLGLSRLFGAVEDLADINISNYRFPRYCKGYDGIKGMLATYNAKLKITWKNRFVYLSAEPISNYTESPVDGDIALLTVEQHRNKVNHLICLGKGDLAAREVIHLYIDQFGQIGDGQYYTGLDEITDTYDNANVESSDELRKGGVDRLTELRDNDKAEIALSETEGLSYDVGDIVGASEMKLGVKVAAMVTQKTVKINNGTVSIEYKTGG